MNVFQGSTHILSAVNLKDAGGNPLALPPGVLPKFTSSSADAATFGVQNPDGTQPVTFKATFLGNVTFPGTVTYASGTVVKLTPVVVTVVVAEIASGDVAIN